MEPYLGDGRFRIGGIVQPETWTDNAYAIIVSKRKENGVWLYTIEKLNEHCCAECDNFITSEWSGYNLINYNTKTINEKIKDELKEIEDIKEGIEKLKSAAEKAKNHPANKKRGQNERTR